MLALSCLRAQPRSLHTQVPLVPLYINTTVQPSEYLMQWLPDTTLAGLPNATDRAAASARERQEYLDRIEATLERDVAHLVGTVSAWIARLVRGRLLPSPPPKRRSWT
jgi:hypothetical protein